MTGILFRNEVGNWIAMQVVADGETVTVSATGPTSSVDHEWTRVEAETLHRLLGSAIAEDSE